MSEIKTKQTTASPVQFIKSISDETKRKDSQALLKIFKTATGFSPKMWGTSIVGYGSYHYKSERSTQEGDWPLTAFSPRKQNLTLYIMPGHKAYGPLFKRLGKFKMSGGSCLYIKKLSDVDEKILTTLIARSATDMKKKYHQ
jgi:hypothetical protein